jgi:uncharacterized membrane protein
MIVSLEAIFLSTFAMISQNRQDDARRPLADREWRMIQSEEHQSEEQQNVELIALSNQVLIFTHASLVGVVIGVAVLGLSVLLLLRPVGRTALHS